jgi:hypothetical protein
MLRTQKQLNQNFQTRLAIEKVSMRQSAAARIYILILVVGSII